MLIKKCKQCGNKSEQIHINDGYDDFCWWCWKMFDMAHVLWFYDVIQLITKPNATTLYNYKKKFLKEHPDAVVVTGKTINYNKWMKG